jgi:Lipid A 3-O-deacylase (PagL)
MMKGLVPRRSFPFWTIACLLTPIAPSIALADVSGALNPPTMHAPTAGEVDPFTKGVWAIEILGDYAQPVDKDRHHLYSGELGVSYAPIDRANVSIEMIGESIGDGTTSGAGGGFSLRGRFELLKFGLTGIFMDASAGLLEADINIPTQGSHFNFFETAGFGVETPIIRPGLFFLGGARFQHISNAGLENNPGYNAIEFYLGVSFVL